MIELDFKILRRILATVETKWIDRWDEYIEEYFEDWYDWYDVTIESHEMMFIKDYVSEKGYSTKREKNTVNRYVSLMANYYLLHEPEVQEKINSLKYKTDKL
jgi:hypothetical protein